MQEKNLTFAKNKYIPSIMGQSAIDPLYLTGEHSYHRRAFGHDYYAPFIYHIILKKAKECPPFGDVAGDARIAPGLSGCAHIDESPLGKIIAKSTLHFPYDFPCIKLHHFCVMPDHVHILLQVLYATGKHLDHYIENLMDKIRIKSALDEVFEPGYCDKPLYKDRSLDTLYRYIRENPHRLAMRLQYPHFFQRARRLEIGVEWYEAYGNLFLFRNPDKAAVKVSSHATTEEMHQMRQQWLSAAERGTVLVSPFISPVEKGIRAQAEDAGARIILITHEAFPELYKPCAHDFVLCTEGRLLIISLGLPAKTTLTRDICVRMNRLAATVAEI